VLIARKAGTTPAVASAIAWALFDCASQASPRGSVAGFDCEVYAAWGGLPDEVVTAAVAAMTERGMIVDGVLSAWARRQPEREDGSAERAKQWRKRKKAEENARERKRTQRDAPDTDTDTDTEIDSKSTQLVAPREKRALASSPPDPDVLQTRTAIAAAYERAGALPPDTSRVAAWIKNGFTPDEITSCIEAILARGRAPTTLKYFDAALAEGRSAPRAPPRQSEPTRRGAAAIAHALDEVFENGPDNPRIPKNPDLLRVRIAE
jgi:hypothetical protein